MSSKSVIQIPDEIENLEKPEALVEEEQTIVQFSMVREPEGTIIYLKSEDFEKFFRANSPYSEVYAKEKSDSDIDDYSYIVPAKFQIGPNEPKKRRFLMYHVNPSFKNVAQFQNSDLLVTDPHTGLERANLALLTLRGLGEGITILSKSAHSEKELNRFSQMFKEQAIELHRSYIKYLKVEYVISQREIH